MHNLASKTEAEDQVQALLKLVGLNPSFANRYPHEFSGGQRQRVGVARALSLNPSLIVCDEPISALDVSIQAQVTYYLEDLQHQFNLTYIFIAHDLSMVRRHQHACGGDVSRPNCRELRPARDELYHNPLHPYARRCCRPCLSQTQKLKPTGAARSSEGDVPSPVNPPRGVASAHAAHWQIKFAPIYPRIP